MISAWRRHRARVAREAAHWTGPWVRYDLVKELTVALVVTILVVVGLAVAFSSPDVPPVTIRMWAHNDPHDFVTTALSELDGTSTMAQYGPPYNNGTGSVQHLGSLTPQNWEGVRHPIDTADDFVLRPLAAVAVDDTALQDALYTYRAASKATEGRWTADLAAGMVGRAWAVGSDGGVFPTCEMVTQPSPPPRLPRLRGRGPPSGCTRFVAAPGPVPRLLDGLVAMARSGALDAALTSSTRFYGTDYSAAILFMSDGNYFPDQAGVQDLQGKQWGMTNETGNWPGQAWLWLYTMWYQVHPFSTSPNGDVLVWTLMAALTLVLLLLPLIPGLRSVPRLIPVHRIIWGRWYREQQGKRGEQ